MADPHRQHLLAVLSVRIPWRRTGLLAILAALLAAVSGDARVFWRWGAADRAVDAIAAAGATEAYRSAVTLNGGRGTLTLFQFDAPLDDVAATLGRVFDSDALTRSRGSLRIAALRRDDRVLRLVIFTGAPRTGTLAVLIAQDAAQAAQSGTPPAGNPLAALPLYPGAAPRFHARDEEARAEFCVATCNDAPGAVSRFYTTRLSGDGWRRPLPGSAGHAGLLLFEREDALCFVYANAAPGSGQTQLAILHKEFVLP